MTLRFTLRRLEEVIQSREEKTMWILRVSHLIVASIIIVIVLSAQPAFSKQG